MRHKKSGRQFGRDGSSRRAMFRNLAANLVTHERIETTEAKAKELRRVAEKLITKAKKIGNAAHTPADKLSPADRSKRLAVSRDLATFLPRFGVKTDGTKVDVVEKVVAELSKRFAGRPGGYTRIIRGNNRRGDNAPMCVIEFVDTAALSDDSANVATAAEPAAAAAVAAG